MIKSTKKAFTLVELIVVIVILAVLATIAFITLQDYPKDARDSGKQTEVGQIYTQISAEYAKDPNALSGYMTGTSVDTTYTNYTVTVGDLDTTKINGDGFDGKNFKYIYVTQSGSLGQNCFEVAIQGEKLGTIYKGSCGNDVKTTVGSGNLYSTNKTIN